jgi:hypothetical protein
MSIVNHSPLSKKAVFIQIFQNGQKNLVLISESYDWQASRFAKSKVRVVMIIVATSVFRFAEMMKYD